jgi:hypothetical protein
MAFFFIVGIIVATAQQSGVVDFKHMDKPPVLKNYVETGKAEYNFNR